MDTDPNPPLPDMFPPRPGIKRRTRKFGTTLVSPFFPVAVGKNGEDSSGPLPDFKICWEDKQLGLTVLTRQHENGRLIADVFCTYAGLLDQSAVSVGLIGATADHSISKTIPLVVSEKNGRSGSADFGPLKDIVKDLGPQLAVIAFLMV